MDTLDINNAAVEAFSKFVNGDASNAFAGLLTKSEQIKIGRRILIANAILAGKTRMEIQNVFHISPNTFTHIRRWLESECAKYEAPQTTHTKQTSYSKTMLAPFSYDDMKRRYPAHFLLFSLVEHFFQNKSS